jgi:hypothetical protein
MLAALVLLPSKGKDVDQSEPTTPDPRRSSGLSSGPSDLDRRVPPSGSAPPGRLDVSVDDETYEAGSGSILVITIKNPFDVPIEILDITEPQSSNLRRAPKGSTKNGAKSEDVSWRRFLPSWNDILGGVVKTSIGFGGVRAEFSKPDKNLELNLSGPSLFNVGRNVLTPVAAGRVYPPTGRP